MSTASDLNHGSLASTIQGVAWGLAVPSLIVCFLRFYTRLVVIRKFGWDDWLMLVALIVQIKNTIFVQISIHYGLGRHIETISPKNVVNALKWDYLAQPSSIMSPCFGRISFALLLLSIVGPARARRVFLWCIIVVQFVVSSLCFIFILVQCKPIQLLWDKSLEGSCWDLRFQEYYGYFTAINSATDLVLAIAPAFVVWHLNMRTSMKVSLTFLMGLGVLAMIGSIVKTVSLSSVGSHNDYTYNTLHLVIWYSVENYLVIIAASIPTLRPLITRTKSTQASSSRGYSDMSNSRNKRDKARFKNTLTEIDDLPLTTVGPSSDSVARMSFERSPFDTPAAEQANGINKTVDVSINYTDRRR